ncbi:substrate-binding domain-containing protein [Marinobacterium aestuariivivens]|uniref:Substrate-binding domain-containing protein n=1 Tax=Marinobacterium aestuariivivens TaxID=1698799 RepID=A0ABW2A5Q8_9GAMM
MKIKWMKTTLALAVIGSCLTPISASADGFLEQAKRKVQAATAPQSQWDGPTSGPKAEAGRTVVFLASDMRNGGVLGVSEGTQEAASHIGWDVRVIDGQGSVSGRTAAFNQAIALKPDGIVLGGFDAKEQAVGLEQAAEQGIKVVGWHSAPSQARWTAARCLPMSPPMPMMSRKSRRSRRWRNQAARQGS